jgi:Zn-finger nucleic acid-binding protein
MRQYERGGVVVDQCDECRGIFLDRGELDHLINAETQWSGPAAAPGGPPPYQERRYDQRPYDDDDHRHGQRTSSDKYRNKKKRKSFFEDLFDD